MAGSSPLPMTGDYLIGGIGDVGLVKKAMVRITRLGKATLCALWHEEKMRCRRLLERSSLKTDFSRTKTETFLENDRFLCIS